MGAESFAVSASTFGKFESGVKRIMCCWGGN